MPKRHNPQFNNLAGCSGKVGYETPKQAKAAIRGLKRRKLSEAEALVPYHCLWCHDWHIGRKQPREPKIPPRLIARRRKAAALRCVAVDDDGLDLAV